MAVQSPTLSSVGLRGPRIFVIDGAFSPTFYGWTELALALGWFAVLALGVAHVLRQPLGRAR